MRHYEVILARTKQGKFELVPVEYETIGRISMPTAKAERILSKYYSWKSLCYTLDDSHFQAEFQKIFGEYF
jgi:hypothetical protein